MVVPGSAPQSYNLLKTPVRPSQEHRLVASMSRAELQKASSGKVPIQEPLQTPGEDDVLRGKWTNSEAQMVLDDRASHLSERQSTMRLRWNVASLAVLIWFSQTGFYRQIKGFGLATIVPVHVWSLLEWIGLAVFAYNIGEAVWYLLEPKNQYAGTAMTPTQRLRMGLDLSVASTAKAAPVSAPRMTPSRLSVKPKSPGSITNIEARRKTPMKGTVASSAAKTTAATPRTLRSPVAMSTGLGNVSYSTSDDFATLTQVLKKIPGRTGSGAANDKSQETPSLARPAADLTAASPLVPNGFGGSSAATPRLPAGRFGLNDVAVSTPLQQHLRPQPTIGLYQTAAPVSRKVGSEGAKGVNKDPSSGSIEYLEPHQVLEKYGVERDILEWVENMHSWFVRHLLRPLCKQIDELDALFEQNGLGHLSCRRAILDTQALEQAKNNSAGLSGFGTIGAGFGSSTLGSRFGTSGFGAPAASSFGQSVQTQTAPQNLVELSLKYGELPQTKERMALEKYLLIPGFSCRDYIIQRVHTLSQSVALPAYAFDCGGSYVPSTDSSTSANAAASSSLQTTSEKPWNPTQHPTDAQLLFHLFCTFMDQTMPPVQNTRNPFTDRYVLQSDRKPDHNLPAQIIQVVRKRPHFCLFVKGSFYDVAANRNNLFIVLILFVLEIQRECAGYLGLTNLGGKHVDLLSVVGKQGR
ncbi:hypothetical protein J3B02_001330 [Coemansia erecta]|uniref:Uncharacterized protein n=1 Tax=Coemansia asiatica TaxID=1052880 RepID=A0A9W7XR78_9FUNG|nr:hypothetical protein LPJ64_000845 [Coemansia asiatica]KAJ2856930.1 hypothetical protein J3B02_001330 [Coemansia erecta]